MIRAARLIFCAFLVLLAVAVSLPSSGYAQQTAIEAELPDFNIWESTEARAQRVLGSNISSLEALDETRAEIAAWRDQFLAAQTANSVRINTLRDQLAALGPEPENGEEERPELAEQRARVSTLLEANLVPVRQAEAAYVRALGLITQLDNRIADERRSFLLQRGSSPLAPSTIIVGLQSLAGVPELIRQESADNAARVAADPDTYLGKWLVIALIAVGVALLIFAGTWVRNWLKRRRSLQVQPGPSKRLGNFFLSFTTLIVAGLGLGIIGLSSYASGLVGDVGEMMIKLILTTVFMIFWFDWVASHIAPDTLFTKPIVKLKRHEPRQLRKYFVMVGFAFPFFVSGDSVEMFRLDENASALLAMMAVLIGSYALWNTARIMHRSPNARPDDADATPSEDAGTYLQTYIARLVFLFIIFGLIATALGYWVLGRRAIFLIFDTFILFASVWILQNVLRDIYAVFFGDEALETGLTSVVINTLAAVIAIPILVRTWGVSAADLSDIWAYVVNGVQIGDTRLTAGTLLTAVLVFGGAFLATRLLQGSLRTHVLPRTKMDIGGRNAVVAGVGYLGIFLAALMAISTAGIDLSSLAIVVGALSVGIGFGLQNIVSNFISGIILLIERPIAEGDWIEVGPTMGIVKDISVRATRVETFEKRDVIVPNADLISTSVTNWTKGNLKGRILLTVGVSYRADTDRVIEILEKITRDHIAVSVIEPPSVVIARLGADAVELEIRAILFDVTTMLTTTSDIYASVLRQFREEGIEIPYQQRDLWLRNAEVLSSSVGEDT